MVGMAETRCDNWGGVENILSHSGVVLWNSRTIRLRQASNLTNFRVPSGLYQIFLISPVYVLLAYFSVYILHDFPEKQVYDFFVNRLMKIPCGNKVLIIIIVIMSRRKIIIELVSGCNYSKISNFSVLSCNYANSEFI